MARSFKHKVMYQTNGTFFEKESVEFLSKYFEELKINCKQSSISELIDLNTYKIKRDVFKIKMMLKKNIEKPFVFISCLN